MCLPLSAHPPWPRSPKSTMWPPAAPCQAWRWSGDSGALRGRPRLVAAHRAGRTAPVCLADGTTAAPSTATRLAAVTLTPRTPRLARLPDLRPPPLVCPANSHFFSGFRSNTASGGLSRLQGPRRWPHPDANGRDEECGGPRERQGLCLLAPPMQWIGGSRSCTCEETGSCREHVTQRDTPGQG